ncbi:MAG: hypothetical protein KDC26_11695 [Armatimonadetes bacterium]|nr:hypothetical protein [Armatimonadota bacterium]
MKRIWMTTILAVAAIAMTSTAFAQSAGPKPGQNGQQGQRGGQAGQGMRQMAGKRKEIHEKILKQLKLTATQTANVKKADAANEKAMKAYGEKMQAQMKNGAKPDREKMRAEMEKMQKTYQDALKKSMGDAKYAEYQKLMKAEMEKLRKEMGNRRGGGGAGAPKAGGGKG